MQFLCLVLSLIFLASAQQPTNNMILFIEGFAEGLEVEIGDPAVCAQDLNVTEADIKNGYALIKSGMDDYSLADIKKGLQLWADALTEINKALEDCGAGTITADIEKILQEINSGTTGLLEFIARELLAIIENDVQALFSQAIAAIEADQWLEAGKFTGEIVGILLNQDAIINH